MGSIGPRACVAAAMTLSAAPPSVVSTSVKPSSSRTRNAVTKWSCERWMMLGAMVAVPVRQRDGEHRASRLCRRGDDLVGRPSKRRIDEREAVVLAHEERVDEMELREVDDAGCDGRRARASARWGA